MPRMRRFSSRSGYMHLIVRGSGKQIIFEERRDYVFYLQCLKRFSIESKVTICAYCLMDNHVHLLIHDPDQNMSSFMQKMGSAYSGYFNRKYNRTGHVFQDRFISLPIDETEYLARVFRYILNNPQKAGLCRASEYPWSSYGKYGLEGSFVDTSVFQEMFGSRETYAEFISMKDDDDVDFESVRPKKDDDWAVAVIREELGLESGTLIRSFDWVKRNEALKLLKEKGLSVRQIERLTGINRNTIQRA